MDLNTNVTGLQHLGMPCRDLDVSCAFYAKLGFKQIFATKFQDDAGHDGEARFLTLGNLTLELYVADKVAGKAGAIDHLALNVQDIEAAFAAVNALGLNNTHDTIHQLPFFERGVKFFTIEGPNQEKVEFNQYL